MLYAYHTDVPVNEIERLIQERWGRLKEDHSLQEKAQRGGVDLDAVPLDGPCPYILTPPKDGFGIVEGFIVSLAAKVAAEYAIRGLDLLWIAIFVPRLRQAYGDSISRAETSEDSKQD